MRTTTAPWGASIARSVHQAVCYRSLPDWSCSQTATNVPPKTPRGRLGNRPRATGGEKPTATGWPLVPRPRLTGGQGLQGRPPRRDLAGRVGLTPQPVGPMRLAQRPDAGGVAVASSAAAQACHLRRLLTQAVHQTCGRLQRAGLFCWTIPGAACFPLQGEAPMRAGFDQRGRPSRMAERPLTAPLVPWPTSGTRDCRGRKSGCPLEPQRRGIALGRSTWHGAWALRGPARAAYFFTPAWPQGPEPRWGDPIKQGAQRRVRGPLGHTKKGGEGAASPPLLHWPLKRSQAGGRQEQPGTTAQERVVHTRVHTLRTPGGGEASTSVGPQSTASPPRSNAVRGASAEPSPRARRGWERPSVIPRTGDAPA